MKFKVTGIAVLFFAAASAFAGTVVGTVKTILTWDKHAAGDPWDKKFIFQIKSTTGTTVDLWSYTDNSVFFSSLLSASVGKSSVTVEYDTLNTISGRKHAVQLILGN